MLSRITPETTDYSNVLAGTLPLLQRPQSLVEIRWLDSHENAPGERCYFAMKPFWLLVPFCLFFASCKDSAKHSASPEISPGQLNSIVHVRAARGQQQPVEAVGVILHNDEVIQHCHLPPRARVVITKLKDFSRDPIQRSSSNFYVTRGRKEADGTTKVSTFTGQYVEYDPTTNIALIYYQDDFDNPGDIGLHLHPESLTQNEASAVRTLTSQAAPLTLQAGTLAGGTETDRKLKIAAPPADVYVDNTFAILDTAESLAGFGSGSNEAVELAKVPPPSFKAIASLLNITEVEFSGHGRSIDLKLKFISELGQPHAAIAALNIAPATSPSALSNALKVYPDGSYPPLEGGKTGSMTNLDLSGRSESLGDVPNGVSKSLLVQLVWPVFAGPGSTTPWRSYGQPFLVTLTGKTDGVYPGIQGLPAGVTAKTTTAPNSTSIPPSLRGRPVEFTPPQRLTETSEPTPDAAPVASFPLEAPALSVHMIAGGREALLQLDGSPYWKRFSFEKNAWLPLPSDDLSHVSLSGNLSALFLLNPETGEVKKYLLQGLQPAGSTKLPPPAKYFAILAGCNSDHAPVHLFSNIHAAALSPETLQNLDADSPLQLFRGPGMEAYSPKDRYGITGDGRCITHFAATSTYATYFNSEALGLESGFYHFMAEPFATLHGVSGGYGSYKNAELICRESGGDPKFAVLPQAQGTEMLLNYSENSPVLLRLVKPASPASAPARISCFSYFSATPFTVLNAPELDFTAHSTGAAAFNRIVFDPYSFRVGDLGPGGNVWYVHTLTRPEKVAPPVLLNWPDTTVARGSELNFNPLMLGADHFEAGILGAPGKAVANATTGTIRVPMKKEEAASVQMLSIHLSSPEQAEAAYPILLHLSGPDLPLLLKSDAKQEDISNFGADLNSLGQTTSATYTFPTAVFNFKDSVTEVLRPVSGCIPLVTSANRVDFFSPESGTVIHSLPATVGAYYFSGCGALIEYDPAKNSLARISVPDGQRSKTMIIPPGRLINGIGMGSEPGSPITLVLRAVEERGRFLLPGLRPNTIPAPSTLILDSNTFRELPWPKPLPLERILNVNQGFDPLDAVIPNNIGKPALLPASHNGCVVTFPRHLLYLSPQSSVFYPFEYSDAYAHAAITESRLLPVGSISGVVCLRAAGDMYKGGDILHVGPPNSFVTMAPCGRYSLHREGRKLSEAILEVRSLDSGATLFKAARISNAGRLDADLGELSARTSVLTDQGPLAILSPSRKKLQLTYFDIPAIAKSLLPEDLHVTSQPLPFVTEGGVYQYQLQFNNPGALHSMRLVEPTQLATLSPEGLLQYHAPRIREASHATISIEITSKSGQTFTHAFPIYILPQFKGAQP